MKITYYLFHDINIVVSDLVLLKAFTSRLSFSTRYNATCSVLLLVYDRDHVTSKQYLFPAVLMPLSSRLGFLMTCSV